MERSERHGLQGFYQKAITAAHRAMAWPQNTVPKGSPGHTLAVTKYNRGPNAPARQNTAHKQTDVGLRIAPDEDQQQTRGDHQVCKYLPACQGRVCKTPARRRARRSAPACTRSGHQKTISTKINKALFIKFLFRSGVSALTGPVCAAVCMRAITSQVIANAQPCDSMTP